MSTRNCLFLSVFYIIIAFSGLFFHIIFCPDSASPWVLLHLFNVVVGIFNVFQAISMGLKFGWKS